MCHFPTYVNQTSLCSYRRFWQLSSTSFAILICKLHWFLQKAPVIIWYSYTALYNVYSVKHLPRNSPASVISEGLLHHLIHNLIREGVKHQKQRSIQPTESDTSREKYNKPQRLNDSTVWGQTLHCSAKRVDSGAMKCAADLPFLTTGRQLVLLLQCGCQRSALAQHPLGLDYLPVPP